MKKEIPMLFSTPMVRAIQEETKTITRRTKGLEYINALPDEWKFSNLAMDPTELFGDPDHEEPKLQTLKGLYAVFYDDERAQFIKCPFGQVGDKIWIREEHKVWPDGKTWHCEYKDHSVISKYYKELTLNTLKNLTKRKTLGSWQRARFLPKDLCRIWLEITDITIERLQDISEEHAIQEGIEKITGNDSPFAYRSYHSHPDIQIMPCSPYVSFRTLWQKINGFESWNANPWVWVIKFKKPETKK